ncbi:MAG: hypothetical protein PF503_18335 [Desulfobacula sp.]|jgi:phosphoribosylaminoimidazole-succinocarboxamide synthase|nr:hypothetical protein [Desulfobacula sp.]
MGSVKDFQILQAAVKDTAGRARFTFSDRYSVFDWGEMPDTIQHKGAAIALLWAYFFEKLEKAGIPTHYLGLVEEGAAKKLSHVYCACTNQITQKQWFPDIPPLKDRCRDIQKSGFKQSGEIQ